MCSLTVGGLGFDSSLVYVSSGFAGLGFGGFRGFGLYCCGWLVDRFIAQVWYLQCLMRLCSLGSWIYRYWFLALARCYGVQGTWRGFGFSIGLGLHFFG